MSIGLPYTKGKQIITTSWLFPLSAHLSRRFISRFLLHFPPTGFLHVWRALSHRFCPFFLHFFNKPQYAFILWFFAVDKYLFSFCSFFLLPIPFIAFLVLLPPSYFCCDPVGVRSYAMRCFQEGAFFFFACFFPLYIPILVVLGFSEIPFIFQFIFFPWCFLRRLVIWWFSSSLLFCPRWFSYCFFPIPLSPFLHGLILFPHLAWRANLL